MDVDICVVQSPRSTFIWSGLVRMLPMVDELGVNMGSLPLTQQGMMTTQRVLVRFWGLMRAVGSESCMCVIPSLPQGHQA